MKQWQKDHLAINLDRPMVDGSLRYQVLCACHRKTEIGSRRDVQKEQKQHRKEERRKAAA